jgi:V/A-type H+-transporting ATPase subunit F
MYKIGVIGDPVSVLSFKAVGLDVFPCEDGSEAKKLIRRLAENEYAILYVTEDLADEAASEIERYSDSRLPAIILIPGRDGSLGLGQTALQEAVERAVGSDIL